MEETKLTDSEQERYDVIRSCIDGDITNKEASVRLGLKIRQVQRIKRVVEKEKEKGVIHKAKGKVPPNATSDTITKKVTMFFEQKKHQDFGPTFAQEKLAKLGTGINVETLRLMMIKKSLWKPRPRRGRRSSENGESAKIASESLYSLTAHITIGLKLEARNVCLPP